MQPQVSSKDVAEIYVSLVDDQLHFKPLSGFGPGMRIDSDGNMVIKFERLGESKSLHFIQESAEFIFSGFFAEKKGSHRSPEPITRGRVPDTPFTVVVQDKAIFLEDTYTGDSSSGIFTYVFYFMANGKTYTHDPEILNKGGILPDGPKSQSSGKTNAALL